MKKDRSLTVIISSLLASVALGIALYLMSSTKSEIEAISGGRTFITLNGESWNFFVAALILAIVCSAAAIACFMLKAEKKWFGVIPSAVVLISPLCFISSLIEDAGGFQDAVNLKAKDGGEYHLLISHLLQGSEILLTKLIDKNRYEVLSRSGWERSWGYLTIVRPTGLMSKSQSKNGAALYLGNDQVLLGVPSGENAVFLAYDLKNHIAYSQPTSREEGHHVRELSPFSLLGPTDDPNEKDVEVLLGSNRFGGPEVPVIKPELNNPNPKVRALAARAIDRMADHPTKPH